jgi:hypothetical protein
MLDESQLIGDSIAYSDKRGEWFARVKTAKPQAIAVVPEVFVSPGNWQVVGSPAVALPGGPVEIVVKRAQGVIATKPTSDDAVPLMAKAETPLPQHRSFVRRLWDAMRGRNEGQ